MLQSMTGFGKSQVTINGIRYTIDIKSLNSKNIDLNVRLPHWLRSYELDIRKILSSSLKRGKVDVYVNSEIMNDTALVHLNTTVIRAYMQQMEEVSPELSIAEKFAAAMNLPDIMNSDDTEFSEEDWNELKSALDVAIESIKQFRKDEGAILQKEFDVRVKNILSFLHAVPAYEEERIVKIKDRIHNSMSEVNNVDQDRFEQELIFYLEKLDITEEKVRLENHCNYFQETMQSPESNGKKLNFITQEMGREINTLGSKSNHAEMQKLVVQMKDELEKIKEQMLNVL